MLGNSITLEQYLNDNRSKTINHLYMCGVSKTYVKYDMISTTEDVGTVYFYSDEECILKVVPSGNLRCYN